MSNESAISQLSEPEAKRILALRGLAIPNGTVVRDSSELPDEVRFPSVAKLVIPGVSHKSDLGAVKLNLKNREELESAVSALLALASQKGLSAEGILIEQQLEHQIELVIGAVRDPTYGPAISVGLGGVWVEALDDRSLRLLPIDLKVARAMLEELRGWPILSGGRGSTPVDLSAVTKAMLAVSDLMGRDPLITEIEINPLAVTEFGATVLDALIVRTTESTAVGETSAGREAVQRMLSPHSVAIIGASRSPTAMSTRLRRYLDRHEFAGRVYLVNPRETEIDGQPCYPSVAALPEVVDVVHILAPAPVVAAAVDEAGACGVPAAVIHASGFAEVGQDGRELQDEVVRTARARGIRLIGPNTSGVVRPISRTFTAFGMALELEHTPAGPSGLITQSGALGGSLISRGWEQGLGFSFWVATGNEADLTASDVLDAMADDTETEHFLLFLETIRDWERFCLAARRARAHGKPVFAYKTGRTALGRRAVESHTGAMMGDERLADVALREAGVVRVPELFDLLDIAQALKTQPLPAGPRVGVISASGGACSLVADECERHGLTLPPLLPEVYRAVAEVVPPFGAPENPVDVTMQYTAQPEMFTKVLQLVIESPNIDMLFLALTTNADPPAIRVAEAVVGLRDVGKPIIVSRMGAEALAPRGIAVYRDAGIPLFPTAERGVRVMAALAAAARSINDVTEDRG
ncbi:MAG: acetate--CoA ligase family protein [Chloroflexota bacterium]